MSARLADLCTYRRDGAWCGKVEEDETNHVWPTERMRPGAHVWRHDPKDAPRLEAALAPVIVAPRSTEYERGYQAGYHAGIRHTA